MGDITSTRPASGAPIATAWGAEVHDQLEGMQSGTVTVPNITASTPGTVAVVFPRPYAVKPIVLVTGPSNVVTMACDQNSVTTTGCTITGRRNDGSSSGYNALTAWLAIGQPA